MSTSNDLDPQLRTQVEEGSKSASPHTSWFNNRKLLALLAVVLGVGGLMSILFLNKPTPDAEEQPHLTVREAPPPRSLQLPSFPEPTGTTEPKLTPEEMALMKFKALQLKGGVVIDHRRPVVAATQVPTLAPPSPFEQQSAVVGAASGQGAQYTPPPPTGYHSPEFNAAPPGIQQMPVMAGQPGMREPGRDAYGQSLSAMGDTVRPQTLWHNDNRLLEGTAIQAIRVTPVTTMVPGLIKAMITEDVFAAAGNRRLLKVGDIVLGKPVGTIQHGQNRVPIIWHRVLRRTEQNDGIIEIALASPSGDELGRLGHLGRVDTHFWQRLGYGILYSWIGAAASNSGNTARSDSASERYRTAVTGAMGQEAQRSIDALRVIDPTITLERAEPIVIIASKDILFAPGQVEGTHGYRKP